MNNRSSILLADDEKNDVFLLQRALTKLGSAHALQSVTDGEEAIQYLDGRGRYADRDLYPLPRLLLLDLKMPRRGGFDVLKWLREQTTSIRRLPAIILSSSQQVSDINRAYELGANSYLVKPVGFDRLTALIGSLDSYWMQVNEHPDIAPLP